MGKASTENQNAVDLMMDALNDTEAFSKDALTTMLKAVVPYMVIHEIDRMLNSIGLERENLEDFHG